MSIGGDYDNDNYDNDDYNIDDDIDDNDDDVIDNYDDDNDDNIANHVLMCSVHLDQSQWLLDYTLTAFLDQNFL